MGEAIGQVLPMAVGVALSPIPIIAVVLMLVTPRAKVNGPMFIVGWLWTTALGRPQTIRCGQAKRLSTATHQKSTTC